MEVTVHGENEGEEDEVREGHSDRSRGEMGEMILIVGFRFGNLWGIAVCFSD